MTAHHWLVHFPVALLVVGAAADAVGALAGSDRSRYWATPLLVAGSAAALLAFFTGQGAMLMMQGRAAADGAVATHAQWGGAAVWPIAASGALRLAWRTRLAGPRGWLLLGLAGLAATLAILVSRSGMAIGHTG